MEKIGNNLTKWSNWGSQIGKTSTKRFRCNYVRTRNTHVVFSPKPQPIHGEIAKTPKLRNILENIWPVIFMKDQGRLRNSSWSRDYGDMTIKCNMRSWTGSFITQVALRRILWNNWYTWNMTYRIGSSIIWC